MSTLTRALGVAAVTALLLAGCSDDPTPAVEIGQLPGDTGPAIEVGEPGDASGAVAFDSWPPACDLVTDEVVQALLPQTASIERVSEDTAIVLVSGDGNRDVTALDARCDIRPQIPIGSIDTPNSTQITVYVDFAGSPEAVDLNFDPGDHEMLQLPGGECYELTTESLSCRSDAGTLAFTVALTMAYHATGPEDPNVYTVDGESVEFVNDPVADSDARVETNEARMAFLREQVVAPLATSILQRLAA